MIAVKKDSNGIMYLIANGEVAFPLPDDDVYSLNQAMLSFSERGADEMDDSDRAAVARWRAKL